MKRIVMSCMICLALCLGGVMGSRAEHSYVWAAQGDVAYFEEDGRIGLLYKDGTVLIPARFTTASPFTFGYAVVKEGDKIGLITQEGKILIEPRPGWTSISLLANRIPEALFYENLRGDKGYLSLEGDVLIKANSDWYDVNSFSGGFAVVQRGQVDSEKNVIDMRGRLISKQWWDEVYDLDDGWLADHSEGIRQGRFSVKKNGRWGMMDTQGQLVVECVYRNITRITDTMYHVLSATGEMGIIDADGKVLVPLEWEDLRYTSRGSNFTARKDGKYGMFNLAGEVLVDFEWDTINTPTITPMNDADTPIAVARNGKYGYIDASGEIVIPLQWDDADAFKYGLARVTKGKRQGLINSAGEWVLPLANRYIEDYTQGEGYRTYYEGKHWGYIDKHGEILCSVRYEVPTDTVNQLFDGYCKVLQKGEMSYMNVYGELLFPFEWKIVMNFYHGLSFASHDGEKYALINTQGEVLTDEIWVFPSGYKDSGSQIRAAVYYEDEEGNRTHGYINEQGMPINQIKLSEQYLQKEPEQGKSP